MYLISRVGPTPVLSGMRAMLAYLDAHKLLVREEPIASILAEALEGFASGRFGSQVEVKRFLESKPDFPKSGKTNYVHPSKVKDILQRPVYAEYVEAPDWGVSLRKGHHEPLISFSTFERVQAVLER